MEKLIIIGLSSTAEKVHAFVMQYGLFECLGFAVDRKYIVESQFKGLPVYAIEDLPDLFGKENIKLFVAIQWNRLNADRKSLYIRLKAEGFKFANLISPLAIVRGTICGDNCWIHDNTYIDVFSTIHSNTYVKISAFIADKCTIGDHSFIGARATIAGGVTIGEQNFIGLGAIVFDKVSIGDKCIVGAATIVKRNVPSNTLIKTSTDSIISKTYPENEIEGKLMFSKNVR